ncbi:MAG: histone deacetylase [Anaerolineae bacterium]|nr:histone deacetylase [Anaerolineae bacterium]
MHELVYFYPEGHAAHYERDHPERPERVETMRRALDEIGWWQPYPKLPPIETPAAVLEAIHAPDYLKTLQRASARGQHLDMDTYTTTASWDLAVNAVGGALAVSQAVWHGDARRGFALTRPPGHHATQNRGMGFCLLNNIALAAEDLLQNTGAQRLAIIDLDQHHGNGTQDIFYTRGDVFYFSTHQSPHYPGTGRVDEIGVGQGKGMTANFPLSAYSGDMAFTTVTDALILPLLDRYAPQMILVSYGFDPHWRDPLGSLLLSAAGYKTLIERLCAWADANCQGRIALVLEGGYDLDAAAACAQGVVAALLSRSWEDPLGAPPQPEAEAWLSMLGQAKNLWGL